MRSPADLLEALPVAIYTTDADGLITFYNAAAAELWGRRPEHGSLWCGSLHLYWPDGRPMKHDECPMAVALKEGREVRGCEALLERPDGTRIPFVPYPTPLRDDAGRMIGAINLLVENSHRKQAEIESARLAAIVTSSDDAIISKTLEGRITSWNAAATRIFGYTPEEVIGKSITLLIPPELRDEEPEILARLQRGERTDHFDTTRITKDGRRINISLTVSPVRDASGKIVGASKVARDITDRKKYEELQQLLFDELNHRVKNTLANIQSIATQSLSTARGTNHFVSAFSGRIQALARAHDLLVRGQMKGASIMEIVRQQVVLGNSDGARITCSGPLVMVEAQVATQLALVLHELATNARKYGALSEAGGKLSIRWELLMQDTREICLEWRESGVTNVVAPVSRGFGTMLIEKTLRGCGGEASIRYDTGGLVCQLRLPLQEGSWRNALIEAAMDQAGTSASRAAGINLAGKRILVVEDEPLIAMEIETNLERAGCEVIGPAGTIEIAESLLAQTQPDAVLLDANLRGRPVDELAAALARRGVPFAFATGFGRDSLPNAFRDAVLLSKPFDSGQLIAAIEDLLMAATPPDGVVTLRTNKA